MTTEQSFSVGIHGSNRRRLWRSSTSQRRECDRCQTQGWSQGTEDQSNEYGKKEIYKKPMVYLLRS